MLEIDVLTTGRCTRGCVHCAFNSGMSAKGKREHFNPTMADKLCQTLNKSKERIGICLTGGGEPLLNPYLPEIASKFFEKLGEKLVGISLVTSGFENRKERQLLEKFLELKNTSLAISIHLYYKDMEKARERFLNSLSLALEKGNRVAIKMSATAEDFKKNLYLLYSLMGDMNKERGFDIFPFLINGLSDNTDLPLYHFSQEGLLYLKSLAHILPFLSVYRKKRNVQCLIRNTFQEVVKKGRGINVSGASDVLCAWIWEDSPSLMIDSEGFRFCPERNEKLLGYIDTPLEEVLKLQKTLRRLLLRKVLADRRVGTSECDICHGYLSQT